MAEPTRSQLASMLLADLGAPDNTATNTAVQVWLRHESGSNIIGNNPLNIHYDNAVRYGLNPSGKWYSKGDGTYVASFSSIDAGMAATAKFLTSLGRYQSSVAALRANNPTGFLDAIARSGWSECQYGLVTNAQNARCHGDGKTNNLLGEYITALGNPTKGTSGNPTIPPGANQGAGAGATGSPGLSVSWVLATLNKGPNDPLTADDIDKLAQTVWDNSPAKGFPDPLGIYQSGIKATIHRLLDPYVGKPISSIHPDVFEQLNAGIAGVVDAETSKSDNVDLSGAVGILQWLGDPAHWLGVLALGVGVAMIGYGVIVLVKGYAGGEVAITPAKR